MSRPLSILAALLLAALCTLAGSRRSLLMPRPAASSPPAEPVVVDYYIRANVGGLQVTTNQMWANTTGTNTGDARWSSVDNGTNQSDTDTHVFGGPNIGSLSATIVCHGTNYSGDSLGVFGIDRSSDTQTGFIFRLPSDLGAGQAILISCKMQVNTTTTTSQYDATLIEGIGSYGVLVWRDDGAGLFMRSHSDNGGTVFGNIVTGFSYGSNYHVQTRMVVGGLVQCAVFTEPNGQLVGTVSTCTNDATAIRNVDFPYANRMVQAGKTNFYNHLCIRFGADSNVPSITNRWP